MPQPKVNRNQTLMEKKSKPLILILKGQESFKTQQGKKPNLLKTLKRAHSSVEDFKAKMQTSIKKCCFAPQMEPRFISYVKNFFGMTDQQAVHCFGRGGSILKKIVC